jgi:hypothetical protein
MTKWLIEYIGLGTPPVYIAGPIYGHDWCICFSPHKALQFNTKEEAEAEIVRLNVKSKWKPTEHSFL